MCEIDESQLWMLLELIEDAHERAYRPVIMALSTPTHDSCAYVGHDRGHAQPSYNCQRYLPLVYAFACMHRCTEDAHERAYRPVILPLSTPTYGP